MGLLDRDANCVSMESTLNRSSTSFTMIEASEEKCLLITLTKYFLKRTPC